MLTDIFFFFEDGEKIKETNQNDKDCITQSGDIIMVAKKIFLVKV